MAVESYQHILDSLRQLYLGDARPWLVGFSGGKDSTLVAEGNGSQAGTRRPLLAKVDEYSESHRAFGLPDDLLAILKDNLAGHNIVSLN